MRLPTNFCSASCDPRASSGCVSSDCLRSSWIQLGRNRRSEFERCDVCTLVGISRSSLLLLLMGSINVIVRDTLVFRSVSPVSSLRSHTREALANDCCRRNGAALETPGVARPRRRMLHVDCRPERARTLDPRGGSRLSNLSRRSYMDFCCGSNLGITTNGRNRRE